MEQATQATTPTASTQPRDITAQRAAYKHINGVTQRILDRLTTVMPTAVEVRPASGIHLHFGLGLSAGRGVLEVADIAGVQATRDPRNVAENEAWIECRALVEGIPLVARALVVRENADQLMQQTPAATTPDAEDPPATTPVPLGSSVVARVPAVTPVPAPDGGQ